MEMKKQNLEREILEFEKYCNGLQKDYTIIEMLYEKSQYENLTKEDLTNLYSIYSKVYGVKGWNYQYENKLLSLLESRDKRKDLALIFNCNEEQIALDVEEVNENTICCFDSVDILLDPEIKEFKYPKFVIGNVSLTLTDGLVDASGVIFPENISGSLSIYGLKTTEGMQNFPQNIGCNLKISGLTNAVGLIFPINIAGDVELTHVNTADGLVLPENIGGKVNLPSLTSADNLELPENLNYEIHLGDRYEKIASKYARGYRCIKGDIITPENFHEYIGQSR